ncbi:DNA recombination protein RmuC [Novosphingobium sp. PS1R-30]|uniref:DNA recombination protein RmuC homolog n=1 Tax=Novosphingobium anseongense TaxID=3133436 RepID=A0ABU8RQN0_9SPHN
MDIVIALVALAIGLGLGWFFGSRPATEWRARFQARDTDARELDEKFRRAIAELAGASERASRVDSLAAELAQANERNAALQGQFATAATRADSAERLAAELPELRASREALAAELATLKANASNFDEKQRLLLEAQEALKKEFQVAGAKVMENAQKAFLDRAQERFTVSEQRSEEKLKALLAPVGERLKSYEDQVSTLEKQRVDAFGQLAGVIEGLRTGQEEVRREAQRLGNSLTNAPKARGRWGERALQNVLEQCGLSEHTDFITEHSIDTEEGRLRPDAIVRIPGNKQLVIDAKVSLNAYQSAFEANDDAVRKAALDQHAKSMRNHVQTLGTKSYQSQFEDAPDYVVMFVPGEHFVAAALEHDPELWDFAFRNKVLLATPTNLVAIARTVAQVWRQDGLAREAREIGRMGGELYDRLATAADHLKGVGAGLDRAVRKYNDFVGSFERNVLSSGRRLKDKHIEIGKREIEEVPLVESAPRYAESAAMEPAVPLLVETEQE